MLKTLKKEIVVDVLGAEQMTQIFATVINSCLPEGFRTFFGSPDFTQAVYSECPIKLTTRDTLVPDISERLICGDFELLHYIDDSFSLTALCSYLPGYSFHFSKYFCMKFRLEDLAVES